MRSGNEMVRNSDVVELVEPPRCKLVEHLALEWDRSYHIVEDGDPIGDCNCQTISRHLEYVAHLAGEAVSGGRFGDRLDRLVQGSAYQFRLQHHGYLSVSVP